MQILHILLTAQMSHWNISQLHLPLESCCTNKRNFYRFASQSWASVERSLCYSWATCKGNFKELLYSTFSIGRRATPCWNVSTIRWQTVQKVPGVKNKRKHVKYNDFTLERVPIKYFTLSLKYLILIRNKFVCVQRALCHPGRTVVYSVGCTPSLPCRLRPAAASVAAGHRTRTGSDSAICRKTGRPQVPVRPLPWLHASHNHAERKCGS